MKLILLPGMDGTGALFGELTPLLDNHFPTYTISYPEDGPQDYLRLVEYVLQRLPGDEPYVLLGESFSGPIAFRIAETKPSHLRGVVFLSTFLTPPVSWKLQIAQRFPWWWIPRFRPPDWAMRKVSLGAAADNTTLDYFWNCVKSVKNTTLRARLKAIATLKAPDKVIDTPCCNIWGANDFVVSQAVNSQIAEYCANFESHTIPGPHMLSLAEPEECAKIVCQFVSRLSSPAAELNAEAE